MCLLSTEIYFGFCDRYLIQIVLCYKISPRLILVKQSTKQIFNTENKPDNSITKKVVVVCGFVCLHVNPCITLQSKTNAAH